MQSVSYPNVHDISVVSRCYQRSVDKPLHGLGDLCNPVRKREITHVPLTRGRAPHLVGMVVHGLLSDACEA